MKIRSLSILCLCCLFFVANAQQDDPRIAKTNLTLDDIERYRLPLQNNEALMDAELLRRGPGIAPRYAENVSVNISPETNGNWEVMDNGNHVWKLKIYSKDAKSLNLGFTKYFMPVGGSLVLYASDYSEIRGPFTPADNEEHEQLWTPLIYGSELVIEVQVPANQRNKLKLILSFVNHDFMGFGKIADDFFRSGSCNVDVICGAADGLGVVDGYRDIIRSVAVISQGGGTFCTGFLVNNMRQDCTPYFMTADHCGVNAGNAPSLVTFWNFENSTCREPGSAASGQGGDGQLNDFNTGSIFRAASSATDFVLVELDDPVSPTANAFLAGWNAELTLPTGGAIAVHHPSTDEKRISFEDDQDVYWGDWGSGSTANPSGNHVVVPDWNIGTTEPGSSGSPVFDANKRVIGQLHGGGAACGNELYDSYGGIAYSWTGGGTSASRLSDWLDPDGTGSLILDGVDVPCAAPHCFNGTQDADETDIDCGGIDCLPCPTCTDGLQNQGEQGVDCEGPCPNICPTCTDGILNQGEELVDCGGPCAACPCLENALTFTIILDDYPQETSWEVQDANFNPVLSSAGTYAGFADGETVVEEICLPDGCYNFILLDSYGDGICCGYGIGSYDLSFDGTSFGTGDEFDFADTIALCITPSNCTVSYNLTGTVLPQTYSASNYISSNGIVVNSTNVTFQAGNYIDLDPDFEVELGAEFLAEIVACFTSEEVAEMRMQIPTTGVIETQKEVRKKKLKYQNSPFSTTGKAEFKLANAEKMSLFVEDITGKSVLTIFENLSYKAGKHQAHFDKSALPFGVYNLILHKEDGSKIRETFVVQ